MHVRRCRNTTRDQEIAPTDFLIPLPFAKGVQSAVEGVIALCESEAACRKAYPEVRRQYRAIVDRLTQAAAEFDLNKQHVTLSKDMFVSKLRSLLYAPQAVSLFPLIMQQAYNSDWTTYAAVVMQITSALEGSIARGASFAVICAEDVPAMTPERIRSATQGTDMGDSQARRYEEYCKAWGPAPTCRHS
ncbi:MAG TPA: hypothetical protein VH138_17835 [Vicinamibacterales bacterium]|nr:hypothetical protein [Vicinamibacterales bacterium]